MVKRLSNVTGEHISLELSERLAESRADTVIYSLQDIAESDTSFRMNTPGTLGCWKYMAKGGDFSAEKYKWLVALTERTNRANND